MLRAVSYRLVLPIAHAVLDLLLAAVLSYYGMQAEQDSMRRFQANVAHAQESAGVTWDPPIDTHGPLLAMLVSGTLPAGIIATVLRPEPDAIWLAIHEAFAIPLWFLLGSFADSGRKRFGKWMLIYVTARFLFVVLGITAAASPLWSLLQTFFWLTLCYEGMIRALGWLRFLTSRRAS
jgi:hypothetical protein